MRQDESVTFALKDLRKVCVSSSTKVTLRGSVFRKVASSSASPTPTSSAAPSARTPDLQ